VRSVRGALSAALAARDRGITVAHKSGSLGIPLGGIAFWCLAGTALAWLLVSAWTSVRRHS